MTTTRISCWMRSNVLGLVAIFIALSGTAYAVDGPLPGQNQVGSDDIINGEVKGGDIGDFEIKAADIAPDSLGSGKIAAGSVKNSDLGLGASSSNTIADGGIQGVDVDNDALTGTQVDEQTLDNSILQARVGSSCSPGGSIRAIAANGTVSCETDDAGGTPSGEAGGELAGEYPKPDIGTVSGLDLASSTASNGGVNFGADTNLFRSAANTLRTNDSLTVDGTLTASGDAALPNNSIGSGEVANNSLGAADVAPVGAVSSNTSPIEAIPFLIKSRVSASAGAPGGSTGSDTISIYSANAPRNFVILDSWVVRLGGGNQSGAPFPSWNLRSGTAAITDGQSFPNSAGGIERIESFASVSESEITTAEDLDVRMTVASLVGGQSASISLNFDVYILALPIP